MIPRPASANAQPFAQPNFRRPTAVLRQPDRHTEILAYVNRTHPVRACTPTRSSKPHPRAPPPDPRLKTGARVRHFRGCNQNSLGQIGGCGGCRDGACVAVGPAARLPTSKGGGGCFMAPHTPNPFITSCNCVVFGVVDNQCLSTDRALSLHIVVHMVCCSKEAFMVRCVTTS